MIELSQKSAHILTLLIQQIDFLSSSEIHKLLTQRGHAVSLITIKRELATLLRAGLLLSSGKGRTQAYHISTAGRVVTPVNAHEYSLKEPDQRNGQTRFNFELFSNFPVDIFSTTEIKDFKTATEVYRDRSNNLSPILQKKELERFIIELSWKSSKIEGNTYTLLDTEKLILEQKKAPGHDPKEAYMILNHKDAFTFVREHAKDFHTITRPLLEEVHRLLIKNLEVGSGLRNKPVGITGSIYRPLDNSHQIKEVVDAFLSAIARFDNPYAKALLTLLGISYIQPFEDGNKRTARLMANAVLLAHECAPLSYRSVTEEEYREAMLVFYELNSIQPFKAIFIEQYRFAAEQYAVR